ncbi:hypothetical protein GCM10010166_55190 [Couchioplanes caeruleus subsp. azureus]|nr:hypothetical protein GCM10010166_55190 [Couchioplanes caeruleus subsp. azureus]
MDPPGPPEVGRPSRQWPLIGPALTPNDARPPVAGGAGPNSGSGAGGRPPSEGAAKAFQLPESAMLSSHSSRSELSAGGRRYGSGSAPGPRFNDLLSLLAQSAPELAGRLASTADTSDESLLRRSTRIPPTRGACFPARSGEWYGFRSLADE